MSELKCPGCGTTSIRKENDYYVCDYCGTKFYPSKDDKSIDSVVDLNDDVQRLLKKIENDPTNAKKYAQTLLQIDPSNQVAKEIIRKSNTMPTSSGGCYVATCVYGSYDCPEVWTLRRFRDYKLAKTWYGRAFIKTYYTISPTIVKLFGEADWFKNMWHGTLDNMVKNLQDKGYESTPYDDLPW